MAKKAVKKEAAATSARNAKRMNEVKPVRKEAVAPVQRGSRISEVKPVKQETAAPVQRGSHVTEAKPVKQETAAPVRSAKSSETKVEVYLQFGGREVKVDDIMEAAREDFCAREETGALQSVQLYLKPQDLAAYYVVNGAHSGKVAL